MTALFSRGTVPSSLRVGAPGQDLPLVNASGHRGAGGDRFLIGKPRRSSLAAPARPRRASGSGPSASIHISTRVPAPPCDCPDPHRPGLPRETRTRCSNFLRSPAAARSIDVLPGRHPAGAEARQSTSVTTAMAVPHLLHQPPACSGLQVVTGFGLYARHEPPPGIPGSPPGVAPLMGGEMAVRQWHHAMLWFYVLFTMVHVYLVVYHDYVEGRGTTSLHGGRLEVHRAPAGRAAGQEVAPCWSSASATS